MSAKSIFLFALAALFVPQIYRAITSPGKTQIFNHAPGPCKNIKGIEHGAEDMEVLPTGHVIMSSGLRFLIDDTKPPYVNVKGSIKLLDLNRLDEGTRDLPIKGFDTTFFNPHGISSWHDTKSDRTILFVINHNSTSGHEEETVEKFELHQSKMILMHVTSYRDSSFTKLNDIKATGPESFYFTNSFYFSKTLLMVLEMYSGLRLASVGYFDGEKGMTLHSGLTFANGINMSPDSRFVYVTETLAGTLTVYQRQPDNNITYFKEFRTGCHPDNIDVDGDYLLIGCHIDIPMLVEHTQTLDKPSPSKVLRLKFKDGEMLEGIQVFQDDGHLSSSVSVAVLRDNVLIIGSIDHKGTVCHVNHIG